MRRAESSDLTGLLYAVLLDKCKVINILREGEISEETFTRQSQIYLFVYVNGNVTATFVIVGR